MFTTKDKLAKDKLDILIIGSGPAGLTAAIYAGRGNMNVVVLEGDEPGGQLMYTSSIENYPGFITTGFGLIEAMKTQALESGAQILRQTVIKLEKLADGFAIYTKSNEILLSKTVIVATGSNAKWLDVPGHDKFQGKGISTCATCDGFAFKGQDVAVIGGGNTAAEDAIYLAKLCNTVHLIHRRDTMRAEQILQKKLFSLSNVIFHWNKQVKEIVGNEELTGVKLDDNTDLTVQGVFVAIGHTPNTAFLNGLLPLNPEGYIDTKSVMTNIDGLYVAGDVMDPVDRQAITSAGYGCMAARRALHFLNMHD